jgi:transcriptional regulator with XRE-family HTH domain
MGRKARQKPERLAEKLRQVRVTLGLSQTDMLKRLGVEDQIEYNRISDFEVGTSEPTLLILLRYARVAGVNMEALADDALDLPDNLPDTTNHEEIKRKFAPRRKSKKQ